MKIIYRLLIVLLIPLFLAYSSSSVFAEEKITPYTPEEVATAPVEIIKPKEKGGVSWLWIILGIVVVGGGIAAVAGGAGSNTGNVSVTW